MVAPPKPLIKWRKKDEELRLAHEKKVKNSRKPSMWQYDPKGGVPTELANLDPSTFLSSRLGQTLCFLPKDILIRVSSMLSIHDFIHLSSTCRFLHWRMFTFCTCYAPYIPNGGVHDERVQKKSVLPKLTYTLNEDAINTRIKDKGDSQFIRQYALQQLGRRGIFVYLPFCLRKPFFFETLELVIVLPSYCKQFYDRILPHILAVRGLVRHLHLTFKNEHDCSAKRFLFNYSDTNNFLKVINASYYNNFYLLPESSDSKGMVYNKDIYINCQYARQMYRVSVLNHYRRDIINVSAFQNSIGDYMHPTDKAVKATLKNFLAGSPNLIYHQYYAIEKDNGRLPLFEYLFKEFGQFEEFFCELKGDRYCFYFYVWKKVIETQSGGQIRIVMKRESVGNTYMIIGREETFEEMNEKYGRHQPDGEVRTLWKMETALEPDESEDSEEDEDEQEASNFCSFCSIL